MKYSNSRIFFSVILTNVSTILERACKIENTHVLFSFSDFHWKFKSMTKKYKATQIARSEA